MKNNQNQQNNVVLITGGSSGIGLEMARLMADRGDTVIICGRSQEKLDEAVNSVSQITGFQCDVTQEEDRQSLFEFIAKKFGNLNMLVNNAGIVRRFLIENAIDGSVPEREIIEELNTNYLAPVILSMRFLPLLSRNRGMIVNVSSGLAYIPLSIEPNYCATKAALHSMTQSMRIRLTKTGIRVTEIFYPAVDTPFQQGHAPAFAIGPQEAAADALKGLDQGKEEIRVKKAGWLFMLNRLMPGKALKKLNSAITPEMEKTLTRRKIYSER